MIKLNQHSAVETARTPMSSSTKMLLALVLGIAAGLMFGEKVGWMGVIGNAVILLMQMTVYPYIVVSLVGGIGKLSGQHASLLFKKAGGVMLSLWLLGLLLIFATPLVFPELESASFFSISSIAEPTPVDYYKLYIPSNPFQSMAEGYVPAMVLFCLAVGLALIGMEDKDKIIGFMDVASQSLSRVTAGLMKILPYGIFAMSASAAGTLGVEEFASMQVYLIAMFVLCCLLVFWVLPWVVAVLTPLRYRDVVRVSRAGLVTAFATGNVFIVLPVIVEECKQLLAEGDHLDDEARTMIDILVPIAFTFPNIGKLTVILFVLFSGWFAGKPVALAELPMLAASGLLSLFGSVYVAIPFMLELVHLPADLFQFFVMSGFITGKFNSMVAVMNLFAITLLTICLFRGLMHFGPRALLRLGAGLLLVTLATLLLTRLGLEYVIDQEVDTDQQIANMRVAESVPKKVSRQFPVAGETEQQPLAGVKEIQRRGLLRVGYRPSNVPFSYYNNFAELVGFDVEIAAQLAADLDVAVEFVPFRRGEVAAGLNAGYFDIAMSGLVMNADMMQRVNFSQPVIELTRSLVVADHRVKDFDSPQDLLALEDVTIAYVEDGKLVERAQALYPHLHFKAVDNYKRFFKQKSGSFDALLISAEAGSAWSLFFPDYGVAVFNKQARYPTGYAIAWDNTDLLRFVDNWVKLKKVDGGVDKAYNYWILGRDDSNKTRRWSVVEDVFGLDW